MKSSKVQQIDNSLFNSIIAGYRGKPGDLLSVLEDIQTATPHSYLTEPAIRYVAEKMEVPLSGIYSVITFYSFFNLKPQGDHTVTVCRGTACHTRGSRALLADIMIKLGLNEEETGGETSYTTDDMRFTVRTVACFGQCALAPVIAVDGVIFSHMTSEKLESIIKKLSSAKKTARRRNS